jgi:hypothetical protein
MNVQPVRDEHLVISTKPGSQDFSTFKLASIKERSFSNGNLFPASV